MAVPQIPPIPAKTPLLQGNGVPTMSSPWLNWFELDFIPRVQQSAAGVVSATVAPVAAQSGSVGTTNLIPSAGGTYRISYFVHVVQPATSSSSVQFGFQAVHQAFSISASSAAVTSNLATGPTSFTSGVIVLMCDPGSPLTYTVTYSSVGATAMAYLPFIGVEQIY